MIEALDIAALAYAARHWPVAPLHSIRAGVCTCSLGAACDRSPGKHPRTEHGLEDATIDDRQIRDWWRRWPDANVAIRCDELFVLDVDPRNAGEQTLAELEARHGALPTTLLVRTGGGGWHHYYTAPAGRWRKTIGRGLDIQAGPGKYVLAPPSSHISGGTYLVERDVPIVRAPPWLIDLATVADAAPTATGTSVGFDAALEKRVRAYLQRCPPAISGSGGHTTTLITAEHVVRGFALDEGDAYALLCEWNLRCEPPWSERELRHKIRQARDKGTTVPWGSHLNDERPRPSNGNGGVPPHTDDEAPLRRHLGVAPPYDEREPGSDDDEASSQREDPTPDADGQKSIVEQEWRPLDLAYLTTMPPARRWLLRHPTRDGEPAPPNGGDGLLPMGKVGILASEGGIGKTNVVLALALAIICARRWLGHFEVDWQARNGRVFLGLAEEDHEEVHRRLYAAAEEYKLSAAERQRVAEQLVIMPLAGKPVALVGYGPDGRSIVAMPELLGLRLKLNAEAGPCGWSLVALDPLARWAGADVEGDNTAATRFVQALETLTEVPGNPLTLVPHHSSKISRREGRVDARGVTAITDGSRWTATLRSEGRLVHFIQLKSNYSRPMFEELKLIRGEHGLLHVASDDELAVLEAAKDEHAEERDRKKSDRTEARILAMQTAIVAALRSAKGRITSQEGLRGLVSGDTGIKVSAISRLIASGRVIQASKRGPYEVQD